jgi:hypothetical protein
MNEKFREFVILATGNMHPLTALLSEDEIGKFAELIVRECIVISNASMAESFDLHRGRHEVAALVEADIKRHFGVEL